jgi:aminopeptidase YwaD
MPAPTVGIAPSEAAPSAPFDSAGALEFNKMLAVTIGTRVAGTASGVRAGDYIAQSFEKDGFSVERQAFDFESWENRSTVVQVTAPEPRTLDAQPIQYSSAGAVEAELVVVRGQGTESDFADANVNGKIALVPRGTLVFSDKAKNAAKAGALAILIYNNQSGTFAGTLRDRVAIPAIALSGKDGQALIEQASQGPVRVSIASDTAIVTKTGHNVIGRKPGATDATIVLGGHYDSVQAGPGANDNGSGTAVLLELAHEMAKLDHRNTLVFIAFDGEELGLLGSQYYVSHLQANERSKIKAMLNFDMLGGGTGTLLAGGDGPVGRQARAVGQALGIEARNFSLGSNAGSDHEPFQRTGIDTVFFSRDYNLLHTPQDTIDQVKEQYLSEAGRVAQRLVAELDTGQ